MASTPLPLKEVMMEKFLSMNISIKSGENPILLIETDPETGSKIEKLLADNAIDFYRIPTHEWKAFVKGDRAKQVVTKVTLRPKIWNQLEMVWVMRTITETLFG
jgi:hypothetical protein